MEEIKILLDKLGLMGIKMHLTEVIESVDEFRWPNLSSNSLRVCDLKFSKKLFIKTKVG